MLRRLKSVFQGEKKIFFEKKIFQNFWNFRLVWRQTSKRRRPQLWSLYTKKFRVTFSFKVLKSLSWYLHKFFRNWSKSKVAKKGHFWYGEDFTHFETNGLRKSLINLLSREHKNFKQKCDYTKIFSIWRQDHSAAISIIIFWKFSWFFQHYKMTRIFFRFDGRVKVPPSLNKISENFQI